MDTLLPKLFRVLTAIMLVIAPAVASGVGTSDSSGLRDTGVVRIAQSNEEHRQ